MVRAMFASGAICISAACWISGGVVSALLCLGGFLILGGLGLMSRSAETYVAGHGERPPGPNPVRARLNRLKHPGACWSKE